MMGHEQSYTKSQNRFESGENGAMIHSNPASPQPETRNQTFAVIPGQDFDCTIGNMDGTLKLDYRHMQ